MISRMINGNRIHLSSISSFIAKGLNTYINKLPHLPHISEGLMKRSLRRGDMRDMSLGQLQVITNDLHSQIQSLNEELVQLLLMRDELHVEQDAMLVDIEDLTRHAQSLQRHMAEKTLSK
ncbi:unnamed protein product [Oncorhynchus mykiss]|uniref:Schwannomin interacting protein 1 C-terminal domain-containing protein n=1 Tax=Oncorhynchus mykiss TaxID=8022 RepID=A0A060WL52_ONCMY|nr:unnamed protein product [Oncorhynchus mykiss]